jgi:hypothetical protein
MVLVWGLELTLFAVVLFFSTPASTSAAVYVLSAEAEEAMFVVTAYFGGTGTQSAQVGRWGDSAQITRRSSRPRDGEPRTARSARFRRPR